MSTPKETKGYGISDLENIITNRLEENKSTLMNDLPGILEKIESARDAAKKRRSDSDKKEDSSLERVPTAIIQGKTIQPNLYEFQRAQERVIQKKKAEKADESPENRYMNKISDIALREFNAQVYFVQLPSD